MARKKKGKKTEVPQKLFYLFYTQERWDNWINTLGECSFDDGPDSDDMPEGLKVLQNFTDDINVEVLKIIKLYQKERFRPEEALQKLEEVEEIIIGEVPESDLSDIIGGIQMRFLVLFLSCKNYLKQNFEGEIKTLVKEGKKVADDDPEKALNIAGNIGALVIDGGSCCGKYLRGDMDEPSLFDDWLIEIDDIGTALKSLKKFDEVAGETT